MSVWTWNCRFSLQHGKWRCGVAAPVSQICYWQKAISSHTISQIRWWPVSLFQPWAHARVLILFCNDSGIFGNCIVSVVFSKKPSVWPLVVVYFLRMNSFVKGPMSLCWASSFAGISFGAPYGQDLRNLILTGVPPAERRYFAVPILIFYKFFFAWSVLQKSL